MGELKPCPFCGNITEFNVDVIECNTLDGYYEVWCKSCGARSDYRSTKDEAVSAWNRRADGWISVDERLPVIDSYVLIFSDDFYDVAEYIGNKYFRCNGLFFRSAHWRPLPEPPQNTEPHQ